MSKILISILTAISLGQANHQPYQQGYNQSSEPPPPSRPGSPPPRNLYGHNSPASAPLPPALIHSDRLEPGAGQSIAVPRRPMTPPPQHMVSPTASQANPVQGIPFAEIKAKFANLHDMLSNAEHLVQASHLLDKYGPNIQMVTEELAKLEHTVGQGRPLHSIPDNEVLENRTFGKSSFDQERYNNLLGISKQTAMSACSDALVNMKRSLRTSSGRGNAGNTEQFSSICSQLKGTQDVRQFNTMVQNLTALISQNTHNAAMSLSTPDVTRNLEEAKVLLKSLTTLVKSDLLAKADRRTLDPKSLIKQYTTLRKASTSSKPKIDVAAETHNLLDQIHSSITTTCSAIGRNAPVLAQKAIKGKKAQAIQDLSSIAIGKFNLTCSSINQIHANEDLIQNVMKLISQEKEIKRSLKG